MIQLRGGLEGKYSAVTDSKDTLEIPSYIQLLAY